MSFDKLIDHLPFLDGSGRRRFVAGGIILIGIAIQSPDLIKSLLGAEKIAVKDILGSPVIAGGAVLMVYAIGSLAEMLGELSLVRAASGIFLALEIPGKVVTWDAVPSRHWFYGILIVVMKALIYLTVVPIMVLYYAAAGFVGYTRFSVDIRRHTSDNAWNVFEMLPERARRGLREPVGNDSDFAQKYIVDLLDGEPDRKWARRLIIRAKDVAATVTALQVVVLYTLLSLGFIPDILEQSGGNSEQMSSEEKAVIGALDELRANDPADLQRPLRLDVIRRTVEKRNELFWQYFPRYTIGQLKQAQKTLPDKIKSVEKQIAELRTPKKKSAGFQAPPIATDQYVPRKTEPEQPSVATDRRILGLQLRLNVLRRQDKSKILELVERKDTAKRIAALQNAMGGYQGFLNDEKERKVLANLLLTAIWILFLPLYLGYFTTLRNAITAILEAAAVAAEPVATESADAGAPG